MSDKLRQAYKEMSALTEPECRLSCRVPLSCCAPEYCDLAESWMVKKVVPFKYTDHPTLKFMGPTGCTVAPEHRPICTVHTCAVNSFGFKPGDNGWTDKYFALRNIIEEEEFAARSDGS